MRADVIVLGNHGSRRVVNVEEQIACRVDLAELEVRGGLEQVAEIGPVAVVAYDIGPDADLPRPAERAEQPGGERGRRRADHRIVGVGRGDLEPVEGLVLTEPFEVRAGPIEGLVAGREDDVFCHTSVIGIARRFLRGRACVYARAVARVANEARHARAKNRSTSTFVVATAQVPRCVADFDLRLRAEQGRLAVACQEGRRAEA